MLFPRFHRIKMKLPVIADKKIEKLFHEIMILDTKKRRLELESKRLISILDKLPKSQELKLLRGILNR